MRPQNDHPPTLDLPSKKQAIYRFTDMNFLSMGAHQELPSEHQRGRSSELQALLTPFQSQTEDLLVFVNKSYSAELSRLTEFHWSGPGQNIFSLQDLPVELKAKVQNLPAEDYLEKLNLAHFGVGHLLYVATATRRALHVVHILDAENLPATDLMLNTRLIVYLEKNSEASVMESFLQTEVKSTEQDFYNSVTELYLSAESRLNYIKLMEPKGMLRALSSLKAHVQRNAELCTFSLALKGHLSRFQQKIYLKETGASAQVLGLYAHKSSDQSDHVSVIHHEAPHTHSSELFKGIMRDTSRAFFSGRVIVYPKAQGVTSKQLNKNLIMGDKAQVESCPELEIFADDVSCTHGATIGRLGDEELFYLMTRGIPKARAQSLLTLGYAEDVLKKFPALSLHPVLEHFLEAGLSV